MAKILSNNPNYGSISPIVLTLNSKIQWLSFSIDKSCFPNVEFPPFYYVNNDESSIFTAYPPGAIFMVPYTLATKVIKPCPELRFWYDDAIIGLRLWSLGYPPIITLKAFAHHIGGFTRTRERRYNTREYLKKNILEYYKSRIITCKHIFGMVSLLKNIPIMLIDIIRFSFVREIMGSREKLTTLYSLFGIISGIKILNRIPDWVSDKQYNTDDFKKLLNFGQRAHFKLLAGSLKRRKGL